MSGCSRRNRRKSQRRPNRKKSRMARTKTWKFWTKTRRWWRRFGTSKMASLNRLKKCRPIFSSRRRTARNWIVAWADCITKYTRRVMNDGWPPRSPSSLRTSHTDDSTSPKRDETIRTPFSLWPPSKVAGCPRIFYC